MPLTLYRLDNNRCYVSLLEGLLQLIEVTKRHSVALGNQRCKLVLILRSPGD